MYKSPIEIIQDQVKLQMEGEILRAVQRVGINVDKHELLRALQYDRGQYEQGYADGKADAERKNAEPLLWDDDGPGWRCPTCGFNCDDPYYLGSGKFCPECGQPLRFRDWNKEGPP